VTTLDQPPLNNVGTLNSIRSLIACGTIQKGIADPWSMKKSPDLSWVHAVAACVTEGIAVFGQLSRHTRQSVQPDLPENER
jgi:hypothetical protein